jgi:hypothetical protein
MRAAVRILCKRAYRAIRYARYAVKISGFLARIRYAKSRQGLNGAKAYPGAWAPLRLLCKTRTHTQAVYRFERGPPDERVRDVAPRRPMLRNTKRMTRVSKDCVRWPVSRVLFPSLNGRWPFLWDVRCRNASRDLPGRQRENALRAVPIWSCSRWGLPCRSRCRERGALLPHHFNLARPLGPKPQKSSAVSFLWRYPWSRLRRTLSGTVFPWSPDFPPVLLAKDQRPSGHLTRGSA